MLDFSKLRTPAEHGDILIEPAPDRLIDLVASNRALLDSYSFGVINVDAAALRSSLRKSLCADCEGPIVVTGHQPEFIHAGVWAKHVVAATLAKRLGGRPLNLVVDSDAPKHTTLDVPQIREGGVEWRPVRYAATVPGAACEGIGRMDEGALARFEAVVGEWMGARYEETCMPCYVHALGEQPDTADWVDQMVHARKAVEQSFGVDMIEQRVSRTWFGPLLADMIVNAERFGQCYNASLARYRIEQRVRDARRPIPDLSFDGSRCEIAAWVYRVGEPRRRLVVRRRGDVVDLFANEHRFGEISIGDLRDWDRARVALENQDGYRFRPRALALTLWARVFLADLFIHGIGGAKYDRITDDLIRRYFGVEPPGMACVSATLRLTVDVADVDVDAVRLARARLRDVLYNPQRVVEGTPATTDLLDRRRRAVAESIAMRNHRAGDHADRRAVFEQIRALNTQIVAQQPSVHAEAVAAVSTMQRRLDALGTARRRDFFFALLDKQSLQRLRDKLAAHGAFRV